MIETAGLGAMGNALQMSKTAQMQREYSNEQNGVSQAINYMY